MASSEHMPRFSILIPTWNNLPYLKLCVRSIRENSQFKNQIIVFANEGKDGTTEWLASEPEIDFLQADENVGICVAVNSCRRLVKADHIVYMNDDMYVCPGWDKVLYEQIQKFDHDLWMLSSTLIEPYEIPNASLVSVVKHYGDTLDTFRERDLLNDFQTLSKEDWSGSSWPPSVVSTRLWDIVGGYSIEFSPGMYSDPDFSMKLWRAGVRIFKGLGESKVYHFQSKSTVRLKKNKGADMFLIKWGLSARTFYTYFLKMGQPFSGPLIDLALPFFPTIRNSLKRAFKVLNDRH
jgi:glycosyltransferase involved in cell wall biosynthesis